MPLEVSRLEVAAGGTKEPKEGATNLRPVAAINKVQVPVQQVQSLQAVEQATY